VIRADGFAESPDDEKVVHGDPCGELLVVDDSSPDERLAAAANCLRSRSGGVELAGVAMLRPEPGGIVCEIRLDATAAASRCEEELKVLVENASRALATSRLAAHLPRWRYRWQVVQDTGAARIQLWPLD
jgi:hypothetical protein